MRYPTAVPKFILVLLLPFILTGCVTDVVLLLLTVTSDNPGKSEVVFFEADRFVSNDEAWKISIEDDANQLTNRDKRSIHRKVKRKADLDKIKDNAKNELYIRVSNAYEILDENEMTRQIIECEIYVFHSGQQVSYCKCKNNSSINRKAKPRYAVSNMLEEFIARYFI